MRIRLKVWRQESKLKEAALGRKTLGLGYGLIATDLVLAPPAIPSNTARAGGMVKNAHLKPLSLYAGQIGGKIILPRDGQKVV
jgi:hypothetical protein